MRNSGGSSDSEGDKITLAAQKNINSYKSLIELTREQCEFCDQTFNTRLLSIKHNATHIIIPLIKLTLYQCNECLYHFSLEDLRSHVLKTSHHTSQFPKIKASQIHTLKTVGYKKLVQSMVNKQAVIMCQDTLNEMYSLKSTDELISTAILLNSNEVNDKNDTKALHMEIKGDSVIKIELKDEPIYEISSESDIEELKQENEYETAREQEYPHHENAGQMDSSEHERDNSSPFRKDLSSPSPIFSPSYEPFRNRIVFENDDDLFEAEEILPDKPYTPKKSKVPILGTNISMIDKTGNSFLIGRQPNKLDALNKSYLEAIHKSIEEDSNRIKRRSVNKGKPITNSGNDFVNSKAVINDEMKWAPQKEAIDKSIEEDCNRINGGSLNKGKLITNNGNYVVNGKPVINDEMKLAPKNKGHGCAISRKNVCHGPRDNGNINNEKPVINNGHNAVNNGITVMTFEKNAFNNGIPVMTIGNNVVNNEKPVTINGNIIMNNRRLDINSGNIVMNNKVPVFSNEKHAVDDIIVDSNVDNEISNVVDEKYTESVHYTELIAPQLCDCIYCGRCFSNRMELIIHESTHMRMKRNRLVLCCVCEKYLLGNYKTLRKHMLDKHPEDINRKFRAQKKCKSCHMRYYDLIKHMRLYHIVYICPKCQRKFSKERIKSHNCDAIASVPTLNTYKAMKLCEMCLTFARNKTNLHYEVTGQYSEVGTRQTCDKCNAMFFEVNLVRRKTSTHREGMTKPKKPMSNADRLKKMQHRLKVMKQLNKY